MIRVELDGAQPLLLKANLEASASLATARAALSPHVSDEDGFLSGNAVVARDMEAAFTVGEVLFGDPAAQQTLKVKRGALAPEHLRPVAVTLARNGSKDPATVMLAVGENLSQVRATLERAGRMAPTESFLQPDGRSFVAARREPSTLLSQVLKEGVLNVRSNNWQD